MGRPETTRVDDAAAGQRADRFVRRRRPDLPFARVQRLFRERKITVDGRAVTADFRLSEGQRVAIECDPGSAAITPCDDVHFGRLWEDEHVLAIDKPPGLVVQPGARHRTRTLVHGLAHSDPDLVARLGDAHDYGLVHRLDRDTSGVLLVAKTETAHQALVHAFRARTVDKTYRTLVAGDPPPSWRVDKPLVRRTVRGRMRVEIARDRSGDVASTTFEVESAANGFAFVTARPRTGRTHQIRVHLAASRYPIVGDELYGSRAANDRAAHELGLHRMFLHAAALAFPHPVSAERIEVASPLPADLRDALPRAGC